MRSLSSDIMTLLTIKRKKQVFQQIIWLGFISKWWCSFTNKKGYMSFLWSSLCLNLFSVYLHSVANGVYLCSALVQRTFQSAIHTHIFTLSLRAGIFLRDTVIWRWTHILWPAPHLPLWTLSDVIRIFYCSKYCTSSLSYLLRRIFCRSHFRPKTDYKTRAAVAHVNLLFTTQLVKSLSKVFGFRM